MTTFHILYYISALLTTQVYVKPDDTKSTLCIICPLEFRKFTLLKFLGFGIPDFQRGLKFLDPTINHTQFCKREMNNLFTEYSETEGDESAETKENVSFSLLLYSFAMCEMLISISKIVFISNRKRIEVMKMFYNNNVKFCFCFSFHCIMQV